MDTTDFIETPLTNDQGTKKWKPNPNEDKGRAIVVDDHSYHWRWSNPSGYEGTNLRIPYRFASGEFSTSEQNTIRTSMTEMGGLIMDCIDFYDDTETKCKSK